MSRAKEEQHRTLMGSMGGQSQHASRATVYAHARSLTLMAALEERGILGEDYRDTETGRKVRTIIFEVSRMVPGALTYTRDAEREEEMVDIYKLLRDKPLAEVRRVSAVVRNQG